MPKPGPKEQTLHVPLPFDAFVTGVARVDVKKLLSRKKAATKAAKAKKKVASGRAART